ncbi:hypothetical protein K523DRAFT_417949 [Schizophyllum commune Tattone D]|nr:hypothetical protein K523DRAFT_417949 [Schizophyllum commune Tattone D]
MSCSALCSICLETKAFPEQLLFFAACGHGFCERCLSRTRSDKCPTCRTPSCKKYPPRKIFVDLITSDADPLATALPDAIYLQKQKSDNARLLAELRDAKGALDKEQRRVRALEEERDRTKIECIWMKQERDRTREEHAQRTKERDELLRELRVADEKLAAMHKENWERQRVALGSAAQRPGLLCHPMQDRDERGAHERARMEDIKALEDKSLDLFKELMEHTWKMRSLSDPVQSAQIQPQSAQIQPQSARVVRRGGADDLRERFYIAAAKGPCVETRQRADAGHRVIETREVPRARRELHAHGSLSGGVLPPTVDPFMLTEDTGSPSTSFPNLTMEAILNSLRNHE